MKMSIISLKHNAQLVRRVWFHFSADYAEVWRMRAKKMMKICCPISRAGHSIEAICPRPTRWRMSVHVQAASFRRSIRARPSPRQIEILFVSEPSRAHLAVQLCGLAVRVHTHSTEVRFYPPTQAARQGYPVRGGEAALKDYKKIALKKTDI